eukprot:CAMPEP_0204647738 /NCGR_PEP_ID=MMETSP0718-20130828/6667_1 /ASSEMBLY_ACC=CAM_ASM_000674 /TAXON_ID=230516 /ORGANISM="Chaetoceros curvisetus" /LENGTH=295 /DNA_ID=CAMNT_0051670389 /DNA_START=3 /DNA_END=890 /DNA_ORIENTATION=-
MIKSKEKKRGSSIASGRVPVSRHQLLRRNTVTSSLKDAESKSKIQLQFSHQLKSELRTSTSNKRSSSSIANSSCRSAVSFSDDTKQLSGETASNTGILKKLTQNDSLRSSYGSFDHLHSRSSFPSRVSWTGNKNLSGDVLAPLTSFGSMSNVSFHNVCVREYPRCIGDNVTSSGPPISIDWKHQSHEEIPIDEYERCRQSEYKRIGDELRIKSSDRVAMLENEWEVDRSDIMRADDKSSVARERRIKTIIKARSAKRVEEIMESARHKFKKVSLKRVFSGSKKDKPSKNVKFRGT